MHMHGNWNLTVIECRVQAILLDTQMHNVSLTQLLYHSHLRHLSADLIRNVNVTDIDGKGKAYDRKIAREMLALAFRSSTNT